MRPRRALHDLPYDLRRHALHRRQNPAARHQPPPARLSLFCCTPLSPFSRRLNSGWRGGVSRMTELSPAGGQAPTASSTTSPPGQRALRRARPPPPPPAAAAAGVTPPPPPQHGLSSNKMALITSECDAMRAHEHQMALITSYCGAMQLGGAVQCLCPGVPVLQAQGRPPGRPRQDRLLRRSPLPSPPPPRLPTPPACAALLPVFASHMQTEPCCRCASSVWRAEV